MTGETAYSRSILAQIEYGGFDPTDALQTPTGHDDLFHHQVFGGTDGLILGLEGLQEFLEIFFVLAFDDGRFGRSGRGGAR